MFRVLLFLFATTLPVIVSRPALPGPNITDYCPWVLAHMGDCLPSIRGPVVPSAFCCRGFEKIGMINNTEEKIVTCGCIKDMFRRVRLVDASRLPKLPGKCGLKTSFPPIDQKYDCKKFPMFHISDSNDEPRHEKQDGLVHAGIKANYIHKSTVSENYKNILDAPMNVENDGMAHDGTVSENYKYIQGVPMTEEKNMMAHKRMVSENYEDIKNVHMIEEHDRMVPEDTVSKNYKYIEDVPMTEEQESITSKGMVSENYNEDAGVILDVLMGFITGLIAGLKE